MEKKYKEVQPVIRQLILRKLGMFASSNLGNDVYYFLEAVLLMRKDIGDEVLQKHFGDKWGEVNKKLTGLSILINRSKVNYERMSAHPKNKDIEKEFNHVFSQVPLYQDILYETFIVLLRQSNLQYSKIPSDAFKILERKSFTKIDSKSSEMTSHTN